MAINPELLFALLFSALLLFSWMGGWLLASQSYKQMADSYAKVLDQVTALELNYKEITRENEKLRDRVAYLERKYQTAVEEIARLNSLYSKDVNI